MEFPDELIQKIREARHIAVLTGAGISAESGVPTFRDAQGGLWAKYDPHQLATPEAFHNNPRLVWEWYTWRRQLISTAKPNPGHYALVELEKHVPQLSLITQNIDGLHQLAGSHVVICLHGNIQQSKCSQEGIIISDWENNDEIPPRCPNCGSLLRPNVVWFGEMLPEEALSAAYQAATTCDIFLSVGTSSVVEPAASLPYIALRQGAWVVEINPSITPLTHTATFTFQGPAGQILPALVQSCFSNR